MNPNEIVFEALQGHDGYEIMDVVHELATGRIRFKMEGEVDGEVVIKEYEIKVEQIGIEHIEPPSESDEWTFVPLGFTCRGCGQSFSGKVQCRHTGKCPTCSDNYEPMRPRDIQGPF